MIEAMGFLGKTGYKAVMAGVGIPVGIATAKAVEGLWASARPDNPAHRLDDPDANWGDAIGFAVLTGAGVAVAQLVTTKTAATIWRTFVGSDPHPHVKAKGAIKRAKVTV